MAAIPEACDGDRDDFRKVADAFLGQPGLPFANVLPAERVLSIFKKHGGVFAKGRCFSTAVVLWSFLGQVLRDGKQASCQAAVARIVSHHQLHGLATPTADTGDYCRARAKLPEAALHELAWEVADQAEQQADHSWLWKGLHAKLVDGFTFTMPDTAANQSEYPQQSGQRPGVGFPIARTTCVVSLATGCVVDAATGPYQGKQTGEPALLRSVLSSFREGDIAVMDRYYCSFLMIALLLNRRTHVCARMHHRRHTDFRRGRRLGKYDHVIVWRRPARPKWMDETLYDMIPEKLELREIRFNIVEPGRRTKALTVVTTLTDPQEYTKDDVAELYGFRWNVELDIRSIKQSLNLDHVRCKSPEMVRRELWTTLLAYNLIRTTAAAAAILHNKKPRHISFTGTCQYVLASWMLHACDHRAPEAVKQHCLVLLAQIATCEVANRPGRIEPRQAKRRTQRYKLMQEPRQVLQEQLRKECT